MIPTIVLIVSSLLVAAPARADVLCQSRTGAVILRAACKKRETRVELPRGPQGPPGAAAPVPVRIVDAVGKPVGLVPDPFNEDNYSRVLVEAGTHLVALYVTPAGFAESTPPNGVHLNADCSDPPLVGTQPAPLVRYGFVSGGVVFYAGDPIVKLTPAALAARVSPPSACGSMGGTPLPDGNCCLDGGLTEGTFGPLTTFDLSTLGLTPPFRLEP